MTAARQLVLDLGHRTAYGRDNYLVAPCNETAVGWLDRWPDWPATGLVLYGPSGAGKSHLAEVWRARSDARTIGTSDLEPFHASMTKGCAFVFDDVASPLDERALLHFYNAVGEVGGHILFTALTPPAHWQIALPDLASRLRAMPAVSLDAPDEALLASIMIKQFADRQIEISPDVPAYILMRTERSFAAVQSLVEALDQASLAVGRRITVPFVRHHLATT